jgi:hypothetical protein
MGEAVMVKAVNFPRETVICDPRAQNCNMFLEGPVSFEGGIQAHYNGIALIVYPMQEGGRYDLSWPSRNKRIAGGVFGGKLEVVGLDGSRNLEVHGGMAGKLAFYIRDGQERRLLKVYRKDKDLKIAIPAR